MKIVDFLKYINTDFYTGVPDSKLKDLCNYLCKEIGIGTEHIIAANEGNAVGIAAGYYLATGKVPVVYLQNSGIGNMINPLCSLLNEKVYGIPCIFIVGWRGEPGVHDEPQHVFQGEISEKLLNCVGCYTVVLSKDDVDDVLSMNKRTVKETLIKGGSVAFLVKKEVLEYDGKAEYRNGFSLTREQVLEEIVKFSGNDVIVSTTGKTSRELFEIRERYGLGHEKDFLSVGSMGHASSIALGIAIQKPDLRIWCIEGDGSALMHMGALAVIGSNSPSNMIHVVINNESHESVGGMPTVASDISFCKIADGCGYKSIKKVNTETELIEAISEVYKKRVLSFIEVSCAIGSRNDLGRPSITPKENKEDFMRYLNQ